MKQFKAESKRLLDLMVNSIYTNKEIFLRELISNASDAIDKMYYKSLKDENINFDRNNFYINLKVDKENRKIVVEDKGIGMTEKELESNLGTIAKSGSFDFKQENAKDDNASIIGQFGVGFYSSFMVADKVEVISRAYGQDKSYKWESKGASGYTIKEANRDEVGTTVILHVREGEDFDEYLEEYRIRSLVEKYSNYIKYPIKMEVTKSRLKEKEKDDDKDEWEEYKEDEVLNSIVPIWKKNRQELKDEDYKSFFRDEKFGFEDPLLWSHIVADGTLSYRAILYIPSSIPYDYYTRDYKKGLELFSNGVMIMEKCEDLLPDYYSFVKGVVDSEDLSLNISREILQQDRQLKVIANKIEKKITDELKKLLDNKREEYEKFFKNFGNQLKAGIYTSYGALKDPLADLLIFNSSKGEMRTLAEYIDQMAEGQDKIYYASGDSVEKIDKNPALEILKDKAYEIFYMVDDLDEFIIQMMRDYKGKEFKSAFAEDLDLKEAEGEEKNEADEHNESEVFKKMKEILGDEVVEVKKSKRLKEGAVALISKGEISIEMEKTFMNQPNAGQVKAQKILEVNVDHPVFEKLLSALSSNDQETLSQYTKLLYDQSRLIEGLPIDDAVDFSKNILKLM